MELLEETRWAICLASRSSQVQAGCGRGTKAMALIPLSQSPPHPVSGPEAWLASIHSAQKIGLTSHCIVSKPFWLHP